MMKYTVRPDTVDGCDCEDCRAGRNIYSLYRWRDEEWHWAATSLHTYTSAEDCKRHHYWGLDFGPDDTWEDGSPIVKPESIAQAQSQAPQSGSEGMVELDTKALLKSYEALERHWRP